MDPNPNYCSHVFKNIYIERTAQGGLRTSACCVNILGPERSTVDHHSDPFLQQQRDLMRQGQRPDQCSYCWRLEDQSLPSFRQDLQEPDYLVELRSLDYNVAPICNARCIICSSRFSSAWAQEDGRWGQSGQVRPYADIRDHRLDLDLGRLNRLYFNGGEPLLSDEPQEILRSVQRQQGSLAGLDVSLNTNGSIWPRSDLLALFSRCRSVKINASVDAVGSQFEYVRYPLDWRTVSDTVTRLKTVAQVTISATVGIHNVLYLDPLLDWALDQDLSDVCFNPAQGVLALDQASKTVKNLLDQQLQGRPSRSRVHAWLSDPGSGDDGQWLSWLNEMDRRRGLSWQSVFPALADIVRKLDVNISAVKYPTFFKRKTWPNNKSQ